MKDQSRTRISESHSFLLPNGRQVSLQRLLVSGTYSGWLAGERGKVSRKILQRTPASVEHDLFPGKPLLILKSAGHPLPDWRIVAELHSMSGIQHQDPDYASQLYLCWFVETVGRDIHRQIAAALDKVVWEKLAEEYDITMM